LCRVIKKNEKSRRVATSSINGSETSMRFSNEVSSQASHLNNEGGSQNVASIAEFNHVSTETNPSNFWISPDMILDSSKVYIF